MISVPLAFAVFVVTYYMHARLSSRPLLHRYREVNTGVSSESHLPLSRWCRHLPRLTVLYLTAVHLKVSLLVARVNEVALVFDFLLLTYGLGIPLNTAYE